MKETLPIRVCRGEDLFRIYAALKKAAKEEDCEFNYIEEEDFCEEYSSRNGIVLGMFDEEKDILMAYAVLTWGKDAVLDWLKVETPFRRKGYGKALFKECLKFSQLYGHRYLRWVCNISNLAGSSLYMSVGADNFDDRKWVMETKKYKDL